MLLIETKNLVKKYFHKGKEVLAVAGLNLKIPVDCCFGLLGPNGAGKTTTLEMIEGILLPTSGEILFQGRPVDREFKQKVGIQFQSTALPDFLHVKEVLETFGAFYKKRANLNEIRDICDLGEIWNRDASALSGGQRQRVLLALALVNDPDVVFLDEPTTGLDPQARRRFWELVGVVRKAKKTVVMTTHYMEEAYELCDEIAIMDRGNIIAQGAPNELLQEHFKGLSIRLPLESTSQDALNSLSDCKVFAIADAYEILTEDPSRTMQELLDRKIPLRGIQVRSRNLDDLFLKLAGRGAG